MDNSPTKHRTSLLKIVGDHALDFTSAIYGDLLKRLLPEVEGGDWHSNPLVLPYTFTCAAALEATLNDHLVADAFSVYGESSYRRHSEAFLSLSLRGKLDLIFPLLSKGRFIARSDSVAYRALSDLIGLRNELVHSKSFFEQAVDRTDDSDNPQIRQSFLDKTRKRKLRSVTSEKCKAFYGALRSLDEDFFYRLESGDLKENSLICNAR